MSTCARVKAAARPTNSVNDELVGEDDRDIVDAPGAGEFGVRPRGVVAIQNMVDVDEGGENGENTSDVIVGNGDGERGNGERGVIDGEGNDERGATGDVTQEWGDR